MEALSEKLQALENLWTILKFKMEKSSVIPQSTFKKLALAGFLLWGFYGFLKIKGLLPKKNLQGQHVFITGGGMGIGKGIALILAKQGCKITIADINLEAANNTLNEIKKITQNVFVVKCDVSDFNSVNEAAKQSQETLGPVDILFNNAGIVNGKKILDSSEKLIQKTFEVNSIAHTYTLRAFLPGMLQRDRGHIITIASIAGHMGVAGLVDYCGSKFAAVGLDESLRMELNKRNSKVKTTCICPYYINTGMFDGIKPSFLMNLILPILDEKWVAKRIVNAVRQNEQMALLPATLNFVVLLKALLPTSFYDFIVNILGVNKSADDVKGRGDQTQKQ